MAEAGPGRHHLAHLALRAGPAQRGGDLPQGGHSIRGSLRQHAAGNLRAARPEVALQEGARGRDQGIHRHRFALRTAGRAGAGNPHRPADQGEVPRATAAAGRGTSRIAIRFRVRIARVSAFDTRLARWGSSGHAAPTCPWSWLVVFLVMGRLRRRPARMERRSVVAAPAPAGEPLSTEFAVRGRKNARGRLSRARLFADPGAAPEARESGRRSPARR